MDQRRARRITTNCLWLSNVVVNPVNNSYLESFLKKAQQLLRIVLLQPGLRIRQLGI